MLILDPKGGRNKQGATYAEDLSEALTRLRVPHTSSTLTYGDVSFIGEGPGGPVSIGIEIKRAEDFVSSMLSGRLLTHQIPGLIETYEAAWVIIEGASRPSPRTGRLELLKGNGWKPFDYPRRPIFWKDVELFVTKIEYQAKIPVRRTRSLQETALVLKVLQDYCTKPWDDHSPIVRVNPQGPAVLGFDHPTQQLLYDIARQLPGCGHDKSRKAALAFPSVQEMINAEIDTWQAALELKGAHSKTASGIVEAVRQVAPVPRTSQTAPRRTPVADRRDRSRPRGPQ